MTKLIRHFWHIREDRNLNFLARLSKTECKQTRGTHFAKRGVGVRWGANLPEILKGGCSLVA